MENTHELLKTTKAMTSFYGPTEPIATGSIISQHPFDNYPSGGSLYGTTYGSGSSRYFSAAPAGKKWVSQYVPQQHTVDTQGTPYTENVGLAVGNSPCMGDPRFHPGNSSAGGYYVNRLVDDPAYAPTPLPVRLPKIASVSNPIVREGEELVYTVTRDDAADAHTFTGSFLPNSTASHLDAEITGRQGSFAIAFAAGQKTAEVRVKTFADSLVEQTERLTLAVSNGRDTSYGYGSIADVPPSQIRFNPIGGGDSRFAKGESTLITGKAAQHANLGLWANGSYLGEVRADSQGNWSYNAATLANRFEREKPIYLSVSDAQRKDTQISSPFAFEKDPITGASLSQVQTATGLADLVTGRNAINGVTGGAKWYETFAGTSGNDYFNGRGGRDSFSGKGGSDIFDLRDYHGNQVAAGGPNNMAIVYDFSADDKLILSSATTRMSTENGHARFWEGDRQSVIVSGGALFLLSLDSPNVVLA